MAAAVPTPSRPAERRASRSRWLLVLVALALIVAVTLVWKYTPLAEILRPERVAQAFASFRQARWAPFVMIALYVAGGLVMAPVLLLVAACALIFTPLAAMGISLAGALLSAAVLYVVGAKLASGFVRRAFGGWVERIQQALSQRGVLAVATIRMVPVAPFSVVNLAAGSIGIRFPDYLIGTALGLAPGIAVLSVFGDQVRSLAEHPTAGKIALAIGIALGWLAMSLGLQRLVSRRRRALGTQPSQ